MGKSLCCVDMIRACTYDPGREDGVKVLLLPSFLISKPYVVTGEMYSGILVLNASERVTILKIYW